MSQKKSAKKMGKSPGKNPAKGSSIKTSVIKLECYLDPLAAASLTVFEAIPQALQNVSYSVSYHLLANKDNPASVARVRAMAARCTAVGWNRYWVKKALQSDDAGTGEESELAVQRSAVFEVDELAQQRISASVEAAQEAGVSQLPSVAWEGQCFAGEDAVLQLVDALVSGSRG